MIEGCTRLSPTAVSSTAVVQSNIHTTRLHVDASSSPLLTLHVIELCLREGIGKNGGADPERASGISLELGSDRCGADEDTDALPRAERGVGKHVCGDEDPDALPRADRGVGKHVCGYALICAGD